jgi:glycosyltransferase involved in cell wall biosynthesis
MANIHFFSDCPFFAGCEFMLVNFFNSSSFRKENCISFTFRENLIYEQEFMKRIRIPVDSSRIRLYDIYDWYAKADRYHSIFFRKALKIVLNLILLKYFFIFANTIILYRYFREHVKQCPIDILHINNGGYPSAYSTLSAVLAANLVGIKTIIYVVNNIALGYRRPERWLDYPFDLLVKRKVSIFITGSHFAGNVLQKTLNLPIDRVVTINNGISVQPITESQQQIFTRYQFPSGRVIITIIANLEERKGHIYLLNALKIMKDTGRPVQMPFLAIVSGPGNQKKILENFIVRNNLSDDVAFYPFESKLSNLLNAVDIVILPSITSEDFPNIILDAMAAGRAVLASKFSGIVEQIADKKSGLLVSPGDSNAIATALIALCDDENLRKQMGDTARCVFVERFTVERSINSYRILYSRLLSRDGL